MEIEKIEWVFQVDSEAVKAVYDDGNTLIQFDKNCGNRNTCAIYFSSNDIYFPNTEAAFTKRIVEKNFYEWYNTRFEGVYKHIFVRDVHKQWYISGINREVNSPEILLHFLASETQGYSIKTIGSSAGGYAAVLYGSLLNADRVFSFNGQFEIATLLQKSSSAVDPLLFRYADTHLAKYYDLKPFLNEAVDIYYFSSKKSAWDNQQFTHICDISSIRAIQFDTAHHGIPFVKDALSKVINSNTDDLNRMTKGVHNPVFFSFARIGVLKTVRSVYNQLKTKWMRKI